MIVYADNRGNAVDPANNEQEIKVYESQLKAWRSSDAISIASLSRIKEPRSFAGVEV